jgi:hypothetical protein
MEVVTKRPTATEVDDYAEYKRLRKVNRDGKRRDPVPPVGVKADFSTPLKTAPPVVAASPPKPLPMDISLNTRRKGLFKHLHFDEEAHVHVLEKEDVVSPKSIPGSDLLNVATVGKRSTLTVPAQPNRANTHHGKADVSSPGEPHEYVSPAGSNTSSAPTHTSVTTFSGMDIREVAPWIDYDVGLTIPPPSEDSFILHQQRPTITQPVATGSIKTVEPKSFQTGTSRDTFGNITGDTNTPSPSFGNGSDYGEKHGRKEGDFLHGHLNPMWVAGRKDKDKRKSILVRGKKPMGKLFDGVVEGEDKNGDGEEEERVKTTGFSHLYIVKADSYPIP